jgi:hypothetical protein
MGEIQPKPPLIESSSGAAHSNSALAFKWVLYHLAAVAVTIAVGAALWFGLGFNGDTFGGWIVLAAVAGFLATFYAEGLVIQFRIRRLSPVAYALSSCVVFIITFWVTRNIGGPYRPEEQASLSAFAAKSQVTLCWVATAMVQVIFLRSGRGPVWLWPLAVGTLMLLVQMVSPRPFPLGISNLIPLVALGFVLFYVVVPAEPISYQGSDSR